MKIGYLFLIFFLGLANSASSKAVRPNKSLSPSSSSALSLDSKQAILIDLTTNHVLLEKNADEKMTPSSMSKILTTYLVFAELKSGRLKMTDTFPVSEVAWRKSGSKMFLKINTKVSIEDLLRGAIIQSGNDACIALAEGIAGSEEAFAAQMTQVAHEMGASHSNFVNSTGWPDANHYATARDLALIALPWSHIMAVSIALYGLMAGIRGCFLDRFDVASAVDLVERFGITTFVGVPEMFARLVNSAPEPARLKTVRVWLSASDHLPTEVRLSLRQFGALIRLPGGRRIPPVLLNGYGMVELGGLAMMGRSIAVSR